VWHDGNIGHEGPHSQFRGEPAAGEALPVLHRDRDVLVVDKPAGLVVHQAPGAGRTIEPALEALRLDADTPPRVTHRLDRDTSGCLVLARHGEALRILNRLFAEGRVEKQYWAVVEGEVREEGGQVTLPVRRVRRAGQWSVVADPRGEAAVTRWRVLGRGDGRTWLELSPATGRMHQLRVHCAALGYPIVADPLYGRPGRPGERLHLLARHVRFTYPPSRVVEATAPVPRQMLPALTPCGYPAG
jgi:tRNA pseudouridine32 synthase/23S rRNA pseudouridine746 synthase/23S rRNA pseudouridine1911/1915/1917 synthase